MRSENCGLIPGLPQHFSQEETLEMFRKMCVSRYFEIEFKKALDEKRMRLTLLYPSMGQESVSAALAVAFKNPAIFAQHRCHDTYLAYGGGIDALVDELLGLPTGCAGGMGGSASIHSPEIKMIPHDGFMGTQAPIATEYSLVKPEKALCIVGDASIEEDYVLASLGRIGTKNPKILFVCIDNNLSILTPVSTRRTWNAVEVAIGFTIKNSYEITDDPWLIMMHVRMLEDKLPAFLNIHTCRNWWHNGVGNDGPPEWSRFFLVKKSLEELGLKEKGGVIESEAASYTKEAWERGLKKIAYVPILLPKPVKEKMGPTVAETIKEITRKHLKEHNGLLYGQCLTAVGWIQNTVPELTEEEGLMEMPMADVAWPGFAVGAALAGRRPILAIRFQGFLWFNSALLMYAIKSKAMWGVPCPLFIRAIARDGSVGPVASGEHHDLLMRIPGIAIFAPMTPREYTFVWKYFMENDDPVLCSEHQVSFGIDYEMNDVIENDADATLIPISSTRLAAIEAREILEKEGIKCNIVHLFQLKPLDLKNMNWRIAEACRNSKFGGLVIDGDYENGSVKSIAYDIMHASGKPTHVLGLEDRVAGFAPSCDNLPPTADRIIKKVKEIMKAPQ